MSLTFKALEDFLELLGWKCALSSFASAAFLIAALLTLLLGPELHKDSPYSATVLHTIIVSATMSEGKLTEIHDLVTV